jgi:uncharacterized repeat protein (TIGR01451 family)
VTLDGSGSSDEDGDPLTYTWTWSGGSASGVNPIVILPLGDTVVTLVVYDGKPVSPPNRDTNTVTITVNPTEPAGDYLQPVGVSVSSNPNSSGTMIDGSEQYAQPIGGTVPDDGPSSYNRGWFTSQWLSGTVPANQWAIFDLGAKYNLTRAYIWNYFQGTTGSFANRSTKDMEIWVSPDDSPGSYTQVGGTVTLAKGDQLAQVWGLCADNVRYVKFDILSSHGANNAGFAEVRFDANFRFSKSVSTNAVNLDQGPTNLLYTIDIANSSTTVLGGVVVTDTLPAEVSFVSSVPPPTTNFGNEYVYDIGMLDTGATFQITIDVLVTSTVPGVVTNWAIFTTTNSPPSMSWSPQPSRVWSPTGLSSPPPIPPPT